MTRRSLRPRTALVAALGALALTGTVLAQPTLARDQPIASTFAAQLVTVDTPSRAEKERLQTLGLDLTEHAGHDYVEVLLHTPADLATLRAADFTYDVRIADLVRREAENNAINAQFAAATVTSKLPSGRDTYRTLDDYEADMSALEKDHRSLVRKFTLERPSLDGREIHGVEIGSDVRHAPSGRPTFLLMGLHHAREWPSGELAMEFAVDLAQGYGHNRRITGLLDKARVIVVPVVNVDGFDLSRTDGELVDLRDLNQYDPLEGTGTTVATPGRTYMRKNCRIVDGQDTEDGSCQAVLGSPGGFGLGVDLNRNYGGFWGGPGAAATEPNPDQTEVGPADPTYRGASAFSEPETQNIQDLVSSRQVTMLISNHTFSNLVLRPNGVSPSTVGQDGIPVGDAPDEAALKRLGARMSAQNGYRNIHGWQLYDTTGTTEDWSYNATGGFGYTFEIGANEFHPPFPEVVDEYLGAGKYAGKGNRAAYLIALEHAVDTRANSRVRGMAPAGATLRLTKSFQTPTWEGSFHDGLDSTLRVGRSGRFSWLVNPSTRPVVRSRSYQVIAAQPYLSQTFEGTPQPAGNVDHAFRITNNAASWRTELDWPTPDDLDLEIYRQQADGTLVQVGSSGNAPGEKESVEIPNAPKGNYVLRVVDYASATPSYTLTTSLFAATTKHTAGKRESYTLTCEKNGKVLQTEKLFVRRGQQARVNLLECRRKW